MLPEESQKPEDKKELHQIGAGGIKSLRTYQSDIADALGKNNVTVAKIAIAENVRKAEKEIPKDTTQNTPHLTIRPPQVIGNTNETPHSAKNILFFFLSILFVAGGIFTGLYFYSKSPLSIPNIVTEPDGRYRGLLASDIQKNVFLGTLVDKRLEDVLIYERKNTKIQEDQISELYFTQGTPEKPLLVRAEDFITLSTTHSPESIRRSLLDRFMFGYHKINEKLEPYLLLKTDFFQNTFTGMIKWEPDMYEDMKNWFDTDSNLNTTFEDRVLKNKDIRILKNQEGSTILLYGFLDKETLLITTNETTFLTILDRFEKQSYVR